DGLIKQGTVTPHGVARACFKSWAGPAAGPSGRGFPTERSTLPGCRSMKPKQRTIYAPIATASHLFRLAGGEQAPQQACADIAALINRGFAIVPMALPARADPGGHGGVTITDAKGVQRAAALTRAGWRAAQDRR